MKRCFVTGASGFIGKALCAQLQAQGVFVRACLRTPITGPWDEVVIGDLHDTTSPAWQGAMQGCDTVFHFAGIAHTKARTRDYWAINVEASKALMQLAIDAGVERFIYGSSIKAIAPNDDYGRSKQAAEKRLLALGKAHGVQVSILQPALVYGSPLKGNLLKLLRGIDKGWFPPLPETHNKRSLVSLEDVVTAACLVAEDPRTPDQVQNAIYVISDGIAYSTRQIYDAMREALGLSPCKWSIPLWLLRWIAKLPFSGKIFEKLLGSAYYTSDHLQQSLGWQPSTTLFNSLQAIVAAYKHG
jgi:UDP-glucose 4-epimerase